MSSDLSSMKHLFHFVQRIFGVRNSGRAQRGQLCLLLTLDAQPGAGTI